MSLDASTLLRQTSLDLIEGLRNANNQAFADMVCTRLERAALTGTEPTFPSKFSAAKKELKRAIGSGMLDRSVDMGSVNYNLGEFGNKINIAKAKVKDLEQHTPSALTKLIEGRVADMDVSIDGFLESILSSTGVNNAFANVGGTWDLPTSKPVENIQNAARKSPGADLVIMGSNTALKLSRHPDIKESMSNYAGSGSIPVDVLQGAIAGYCRVPREKVFIFEPFYNSANLGQNAVFTYVADDLFWIGHQRGLLLAEQEYDNSSVANLGEVFILDGGNTWEIGAYRVADIVRADKDLGVTITGTV